VEGSLIAGVDATYAPSDRRGTEGVEEDLCWAAAVLWDCASGRVVEQFVAQCRVTFPYVPGLLAERELPGLLQALGRLTRRPDAVLCDGHGRAHPLRFGLACRLGEAAHLPAVGCAKRRLVGKFKEPAAPPGSTSPLVDRGERIGTVLRTRAAARPVYVSVGSGIELPEAEALVMACIRTSRIPEPLRLAHLLAARAARAAG